MTPFERNELIEKYRIGPKLLSESLNKIPADALKWREAEGKWSAHEVILHCADAETNAAMRIRYLIAEKDLLIVGYDQDKWAKILDYHSLPLSSALKVIEVVRENTYWLLKRLSDDDWQKVGKHTEHDSYSAEKWLEIYSKHLETHSNQLLRILDDWKKQ